MTSAIRTAAPQPARMEKPAPHEFDPVVALFKSLHASGALAGSRHEHASRNQSRCGHTPGGGSQRIGRMAE